MLTNHESTAIALALEQFHATGRALCDRPLATRDELARARRDKLRWGTDVTLYLNQLAGREASLAFVDAGSFPLELDVPDHDREARHFREVVLAQVMHIELLIGPHA